MADETNSRPWMWPAEWAVSHSFWREVATRTVAGVLTVVFLGIPGVIYAVSFGALTTEQGWLIGIGLGLVVVLIALYVAFLSIIRAIAQGAERRALTRAQRQWAMLLVEALRRTPSLLALAGAVIFTAFTAMGAFEAFNSIFGR